MKRCTKCWVEKDESEFYKKNKTRIEACCKQCVNARNKAYRSDHAEHINKARAEYRAANIVAIKARNNARYAEDESFREMRKAYAKEYAAAHREAINARIYAWRKESGRIAEYSRQWRLRHPDRAKAFDKAAAAKGVLTLSDAYVRRSLYNLGIRNPQPDLIELQREKIRIQRATKQLTQTIKEIQDGFK